MGSGFSFEVHEANLHGHRAVYRTAGSGPTVVLIHGMINSSRHWEDVAQRLAGSYRVIAPDLIGHGDAATPRGDYSLGAHAATLRDLLDRLGIEQVTLVGHSLGGGIAMVFSYLFPERVDRLVLVASGGLGREVSALLRSATLPGAEYVLPVIASGWMRERIASAGRLLGSVGLRPGRDLTEVWDGFTSLGDADTRRAFLATTRAVIDPGGQTVNAHDYLPDATPIPTLVVWGTKDRMIPAWHAASATASMANCRVELFQGAGHFPHLDDPDRFAALVREFVADAV